MKKVFKWIGIALGAIVLILLIVAAWVQFTPMPKYEVVPPVVQLPNDSLSLARGKKIVEASCIHCHMGEDGKMSGRLFSRATDPFGEMWTSNITQHPTKGKMGVYTDGELAYLIRTGVNREGRWVGGMMTRSNLSDEDLACMIAYLRSDAGIMQPSEADHPKPAYLDVFMVKALAKFGMFKPTPYDGKPRTAPPPTDQLAYGRYLVHEVYECYTCHSASFETTDPVTPEKSVNYFGGGNMVPDDEFNETISRNLTPSKEHGLGNWTEEQFRAAVTMGVRPDGVQLKKQMPRYAALDSTEVSAIWAYLQTVPVIDTDPLAAPVKK